MPNRPNDYIDIPAKLFKKFFEALCEKILEKELHGKLPDKVYMYHVSLFSVYKKDTKVRINKYLQTVDGNNSSITSPKYLHGYYSQILKDKINVVSIEGIYLYNCLIYMGIKKTKNVLKIVSLPRRAKFLLEKFEAQEKAKETKSISEETGPTPIQPEEQAEQNNPVGFDPAFYYKQKHQHLLTKRKIDKIKQTLWGAFGLISLIYCGYFLWHIFKRSVHLGNWWWFAIAAFFIAICIFQDAGSEKRQLRFLLEIRKLEYYFATGLYINEDSYFVSAEYRQWLLKSIPLDHKVQIPTINSSPKIEALNDPIPDDDWIAKVRDVWADTNTKPDTEREDV